jgi:glycosyltransferase involved in cell wall biosynthesis
MAGLSSETDPALPASGLSVILITRDEEANISECLASVDFAQEVIVVDSGSRDRTVELARSAGARVVQTGDWPGFGPQKNRALAYATGDWVLSLDADEWVTPELARQLREAAAQPGAHAAFRMPRLSTFCGREMRHSGWWPDHVVRFFRRGAATFSTDLVHERVVVSGSTGTLAEPVCHETYVDLEEMLEKMNSYSTLWARDKHAQGRRASLVLAVAKSLWSFFRSYILRRGFLDGREGFLLAVSMAENTYYRYVKLMLLDRRR